MSNKMFSSSIHQSRVFHALRLLSIVLLMQTVGAAEFRVGDSKGWTANGVSYGQWAETKRFRVGDSLLFVYQGDKDSVVQVNKEDFDKCNKASPIASFNDGNTSFKLNQSGPYYFISGVSENCYKNEKLVVIVLANRNNKSPPPPPPPNTNQTSIAPSPPPTLASPPSPSPPSFIGDAIPSPAPVGEESPSPPTPTTNAAASSSTFTSFLGCLGTAIFGSLVLLVQ